MSTEVPSHVKGGAREVERAIKKHLSQDSKKYTATFKMKKLDLNYLNAYTDAIGYLEEQGIIEAVGVNSSATNWQYNGPEGTDKL